MRLLRRELGAACEICVVLAGVGIEVARALLEDLERMCQRGEGPGLVLQYLRAVERREIGVVAGLARARDGCARILVRHFERRQERKGRLLAAAIHAAVPGQAAGRTVVDAVVALVGGVVIVLAERRRRLEIGERGHGAQSRLSHVLAAELHRAVVRRRETVRRIVAGGAGHLPGGGQRRIEEQLAPERLERCRAGIGLRPGESLGATRPSAGNEEPGKDKRGQRAARFHDRIQVCRSAS